MFVTQWNVTMHSFLIILHIGSTEFKETSLWKVSTISFQPRLVLTANHNHIVNLWSFFFSQSVRSCFVEHQRTGTKKEKRGFPFDPRFLIRWCDLNVDTAVVPSESPFKHVCCIELSYELCGSDTTGLRYSRSINSTATNSQQCKKFVF